MRSLCHLVRLEKEPAGSGQTDQQELAVSVQGALASEREGYPLSMHKDLA